MQKRFTAISVGLACAAVVFLLVFPVYTGYSSDGTTSHATLLQVNGLWSFVPMTFPVIVTLMPMLFPRQWVRVTAAIVMGVFVLISGMTIGIFYLPAAVLMLLAACT